MNSIKELPHVLAISAPMPGHINPLVYVCEKLLPLGFRVTFVNTHEIHKSMFKTLAPTSKDGIEFVGVPDGIPEREHGSHPPSGMEAINLVLQSVEGMKPAVEQLVDKMFDEGNPVACIIADVFLYWPQNIANKHGIPRVAFCTTGATADLIALYLRRLRTEGFVPVKTRTTGDKLIEFIPGLPSFSPLDIPLGFHREHSIIDLITLAYERLLEARWILSSTFEALEFDAIKVIHNHFQAKKFLPIGPFLPSEHLSPPDDKNEDRLGLNSEQVSCLEWLDTRPDTSVLYVAFGSMAVMSKEQFVELVSGLEASQQSILWAIRPNFIQDFPHDFYNSFVDRVKDRFFSVLWAPQLHVLRHRAIAGFLSHCGWNSTIESVCAGVPILGWPCLAEQNLNCWFLVKHKLGLKFTTGQEGLVNRSEISKTVVSLMEGEEGREIKKNAELLRDEARKTVLEGGSSYTNFHIFVKSLQPTAVEQ